VAEHRCSSNPAPSARAVIDEAEARAARATRTGEPLVRSAIPSRPA
jgi:hypothetical protein